MSFQTIPAAPPSLSEITPTSPQNCPATVFRASSCRWTKAKTAGPSPSRERIDSLRIRNHGKNFWSLHGYRKAEPDRPHGLGFAFEPPFLSGPGDDRRLKSKSKAV